MTCQAQRRVNAESLRQARLVRLIERGRRDGSIQVDYARVAASWILSPPLSSSRLSQLWPEQAGDRLAEQYADLVRRSLRPR